MLLVSGDDDAVLLGLTALPQLACASLSSPQLSPTPVHHSALQRLELPRALSHDRAAQKFADALRCQSAVVLERMTATDSNSNSTTHDKDLTIWSRSRESQDQLALLSTEAIASIYSVTTISKSTKHESRRAPTLSRVKLDEDMQLRPTEHMQSASTSVFATVLRKNAAFMLIRGPSKLRLFKSSAVAHAAARRLSSWQAASIDDCRVSAVSDGQQRSLQQLMAPSRVVSTDEERQCNVLQWTKHDAARVLERVQTSAKAVPPRSLTSVLLSVPSLWHLEALARIDSSRVDQVFEWQHPECPSQEKEIEDTAAAGNTRVLSRDLAAPTHGKDDVAAREGVEIEPLRAADTKRTSSSTTATLVLPDDGATTTDDLMRGFLGIASSHLPTAPEPPHATSLSSSSASRASSTLTSRVTLPIEHLARPVLWDLARKKVLRVNPNSVQCALDALSLELLESIVYQQQAIVGRISKNPSAFSHDAIFDACASFRQVVWLHTLRFVCIHALSLLTLSEPLQGV